MIRMLMLLCAGIFVTLQVGGQDRGQMRFGLMEAARKPAPFAPAAPVDEPVTRMAAQAAEMPVTDAAIMPVVFAPARPVMAPAVQSDAVLQDAVLQQDAVPQTETVAFVDDGAGAAEVMYVTGRSVNVRSGPSTRNGVVGRLTRGEAVSVVSVEDNGWARVRVEGDGIDGFMAMNFLADAP